MKNHLLLTAIAALVAVLASAAVETRAAQTAADAPLPRYEASVKRNTTSGGMISMRGEPAGRTVTGMPLRQLIVQSYGIQPSQLIGGPDWLTTDRWDIQLRADSAVTPAQVNLLMQQMMADRFKLVVHRETRELPLFELRMAREDGQPGPELKPATIDCGPQGRGRGGPPPPAPGADGRGGAVIGRGASGGGTLAGCRMMLALGRVEAMGQPLAPLISFLSNQMGRPVIDRTGLTGNFDLVLSWNPEGGRGLTGGPLPPGIELPPIDPNAPSLVTALQEQLGLKVESTRGPVEVLVIESVQQPSEN